MSYKKIGEIIQLVDNRNRGLKINHLVGLTINKKFIPSVANTIGTDMSNYKIIRRNQFACSTMQVRRDKKMPVALLKDFEEAIISQAYPVFEIKDENDVLPDYLMMWFSRSEFDREACFHAVGGVRGSLEWEDFCNMELPIPSIEKQQEIVAQYQAVADKININEQICEKLEATAQALYKHWFVDFEFPNENGQPYKSSGGKMIYNEELEKEIPEGWEVKSLGEVCDKIASGSTPSGGKENYKTEGISLVRSMNVHDLEFIYDDLAYIDNEQAKKLSNVIIENKDLLFNITGVSVARCAVIPRDVLPARVNQHVMMIRPTRENNLNYYLLMNLISSESKNALLGISQSGSTREAITKSEIENFKVLIPGSNELMLFENQVDYLFDYKNAAKNQNQKLTQLQSLLLSRLARLEGVKIN